jgi:hypothetical protein
LNLPINRLEQERRKRIAANGSKHTASTNEPYSLAKILGIWAAAALPMGILGWVVYPALTPDKRFRSTWLAIIAHALANVILLPMILMVVLGLM